MMQRKRQRENKNVNYQTRTNTQKEVEELRAVLEDEVVDITPTPDISPEFLETCETEFKSNPVNVIARNAIVSVGSLFSTTNSSRVNQLTHIFMNSVKKRHLKATNQGHSGRCWMFAALNTFRHVLIKALELENFEFSETYLFFWDKLERCNSYVRWFIDNPEEKPNGRAYTYMLEGYMCDGGWWNTFANLVNKYGLVPKNSMNETASSEDSDEMNRILKEYINACVNHITKNRNKYTTGELLKIKDETMKHVYNTLVKFLGEPPKKFLWSFKNDEDEGTVVSNLTPLKFKSMVTQDIDMNNDFIVLAHIPTKDFKYYQMYEIRNTNNVYEGQNCRIFNVPLDELSKYSSKSIENGIAVWFVGDVSQSFNFFHSALDDELDDHKTVFGETYKFDKGERIVHRNVQGNHAMALTGFNMDSNGKIREWQVENSWGYWDNETPGLDGYLSMSHSWFKKYVMAVTIHREFLSRSFSKNLEGPIIEINPWDSMAPAVKANVIDAPKNYEQFLAKKSKR